MKLSDIKALEEKSRRANLYGGDVLRAKLAAWPALVEWAEDAAVELGCYERDSGGCIRESVRDILVRIDGDLEIKGDTK